MNHSEAEQLNDIYTDGTYLRNNEDWHIADSPWKADKISQMLHRNRIAPNSICEIGCGAGRVLKELSERLPDKVEFTGYEISPQAFALCSQLAGGRLSFVLEDLLHTETQYDLALAIDVFEHVEDYFGFIREMCKRADFQLFHIPLDLSVQSIWRGTPIREREAVGHLHYFYKDTALATLRDSGCEIVDWCYTASDFELPGRGWRANLMKLPRKVLFTIHKDFAARLLGGFSLLALTRNA